MSSKRLLTLMGVAGAACGAAWGQEPVPAGTPVRELVWNGTEAVEVPRGYGERAATVYDTETGATCAAYIANSNILEDVSFGPVGPWATTTNNVLRSIRVPLANSGTSLISYDVRVTIWDTASFSNNPMVTAGQTPLFRQTFAINNLGNGLYNLTSNLVAPYPTLPDSQVYIQMEFFARGTTTLLPITTGNPSRTWGLNRLTTGPGSTAEAWGLDINNNGIFEGGALGTTDHRRTAFTTGACTGQTVTLPFILTGDVPVTPPTSTDLGTLGDALSRTDAHTAGQVRWYRFNLPTDVTDALRTYLDITTLNSGMANTAMALFGSDGNIVWQDENSGPDELAQLTFGIGRRPGDGNGAQFDGYDGELFATNTYYLAVAEGGTRFSDAFIVTPVSPGTAGSVTLTIRSNVVSNALAPSVAPDNAADLGQLVAPGAQGPNVLPGQKNVLWYRFEVCRAVDGSSPESFLDIDFARCDPTGDADQIAFLFDAAGNLRHTSDDDGPGLFPQMSFGDAGPRGPYQANGEPFTGATSPGIELGTYYLGVGHYLVRPLENAATNGRFHIRPLGGDDLNIAVDFYVGNADCGSSCPACPADFDNSGGVDGSDVEAFYRTWETGETCGDTNQDGSVDGSDVETFFTLWEAGGC
ncbi:MAG: hypothetical protein JNK25_10940 [Phycisphaerae bacterium]|nr:hypothetical protein [Phycisphaerae bacterium]